MEHNKVSQSSEKRLCRNAIKSQKATTAQLKSKELLHSQSAN